MRPAAQQAQLGTIPQLLQQMQQTAQEVAQLQRQMARLQPTQQLHETQQQMTRLQEQMVQLQQTTHQQMTQLQQQMAQLQQQTQAATDKLERVERNSSTRNMNAQAGPSDVIQWLVNGDGVLPVQQPIPLREFDQMTGEALDALLQHYGLPAQGSVTERHCQLLCHLGKYA